MAAARRRDVREGPAMASARRDRVRVEREDGTMIIVDRALRAREEEGRPIRVGMIGAGFMGQGLTNQIENSVPGMRMAAIFNRHPQRAVDVYEYAGHQDVTTTASQSEFDNLVGRASRSSARILSCCRAAPTSTFSSTSPDRSSSVRMSSSTPSSTASPSS